MKLINVLRVGKLLRLIPLQEVAVMNTARNVGLRWMKEMYKMRDALEFIFSSWWRYWGIVLLAMIIFDHPLVKITIKDKGE